MTHKYVIIVYWSEEDAAYVSEVSELPGCKAHGTTPESALGNCGDAMDLWLESAREFGRTFPQPKGSRLQFA